MKNQRLYLRAGKRVHDINQWIAQACEAIDQGQSVNAFVANAHPTNRRLARDAYRRAAAWYKRNFWTTTGGAR